MCRKDGIYEIYVVEWCGGNNKWHRMNFDAVWVDEEYYDKTLWEEFYGDCWEATDINGTFKLENAIKLFCILQKHSINKYEFRVVKLTISQKSEVVWNGNTPGQS